ncbi:MAG: Radical SAM superfamily protein [Candidatus Argoarchaeum ethanivorans]|uniref:Radical SAM superfamily protein n=1 Tax=Candidatus Argoarchaeum ethanivorans TaxID=2608793 RepID=A0A811T8E3_9EURY|nr:MAG: Radical SAM superfamily protein [Candidatus Argoarchaeum ethanivorans]
MNILLINLPRYKSIPVTREERCEFISKSRVDTPATLLIMASLLRDKGHKIEFIDANAFDLDYEDISERTINKKNDCVIFSFNSQIIDHDLEICNIAKKTNPSCITIGYSWYARYYAKEILTEYSNLDVYIIGSTLSVVGNLIECISENGNLDDVGGIVYRSKGNIIKINNTADSEIKFNNLPMPAYDLLPSFKPYYLIDPFISPYALLYAGKGCPFGCMYCNVAKTKYNGRSADNIIKELKMLKKMGNVKYVWFFDESFTINRKRVVDVCEGILEEDINIKWFCDSRVDLVDEELLKIMRKGGCIGISYGVESGSQKILNNMNKGNTVEQAKNALIWTRKAHIPIQLNLILGFIGEDVETLKETESFVRATLPETLQIGIINAKPGTEFTKLAIENKWAERGGVGKKI